MCLAMSMCLAISVPLAITMTIAMMLTQVLILIIEALLGQLLFYMELLERAIYIDLWLATFLDEV